MAGVFDQAFPATGGGGACDYPDASAVREGVAYAYGALVGVSHAPPQSKVELDYGYGANRNEFFGSAEFSPVSPVSTANEVRIVRGDDYKLVDGRAIEWSSDVADQWPDLTDAVLVFNARNEFGGLLAEPVVVTPTGEQLVRLELTKEQTKITSSVYRYDIEATLASGHVVTLLRGDLVVEITYTNP